MISNQEFYVEVGRRIRQARENLGISQQELASQVSLTRTSVTNIEKGRQKFLAHTLVDLASALQVDLMSLLPKHVFAPATELDELLENHPLEEKKWIKAALVLTKVEVTNDS